MPQANSVVEGCGWCLEARSHEPVGAHLSGSLPNKPQMRAASQKLKGQTLTATLPLALFKYLQLYPFPDHSPTTGQQLYIGEF